MILKPNQGIFATLTVLAVAIAPLTLAGPTETVLPDVEGGITKSFTSIEWNVDTAAMRDAILREEPVKFMVGDGREVPVTLFEVDLFVGEPAFTLLDENLMVIDVVPANLWSYRGKVVGDPTSRVVITIDDAGILGTVQAFDATYHYQAMNPENPSVLQQPKVVQVRWVEDPLTNLGPQQRSASPLQEILEAIDTPETPDVPETPDAPEAPDTGDSGCRGRCWIYKKADVELYADKSYLDVHSDAGTRMANAYNEHASMWEQQVDIKFGITGINLMMDSDFSTNTTCSGHLGDFIEHHPSSREVEGHQLFTGINLEDCLGLAPGLPAYGTMRSEPDDWASILEAVDHTPGWYDPTTSFDLGLVSGHETGHVWSSGHQDTTITQEGYYNIMRQGDGKGFWLTDKSTDWINDGTNKAWGYDPDDKCC